MSRELFSGGTVSGCIVEFGVVLGVLGMVVKGAHRIVFNGKQKFGTLRSRPVHVFYMYP